MKEQQQALIEMIKQHERLCEEIDGANEELKREKERGRREEKYLLELDEREQHLQAEYVEMLEKMSSGSSERVQVKDLNQRIAQLEQQIQEMEQWNGRLKGEIGRTSQSVGQYMREMNNLLDCHELSSVANMEVDQDSEEEENNRLVANRNYAQERKHAGTGGSSKMRARPSNQPLPAHQQ